MVEFRNAVISRIRLRTPDMKHLPSRDISSGLPSNMYSPFFFRLMDMLSALPCSLLSGFGMNEAKSPFCAAIDFTTVL